MYASAALANGAYGTAKDNVTNHIAYYTIVGQFVCALRIGLQEAQTQHAVVEDKLARLHRDKADILGRPEEGVVRGQVNVALFPEDPQFAEVLTRVGALTEIPLPN